MRIHDVVNDDYHSTDIISHRCLGLFVHISMFPQSTSVKAVLFVI